MRSSASESLRRTRWQHRGSPGDPSVLLLLATNSHGGGLTVHEKDVVVAQVSPDTLRVSDRNAFGVWSIDEHAVAHAAGAATRKGGLLPTFFFEGADGSYEVMVDSTPIIARLEQEHDGRSVIPSDPAIAFLDAMLEEYADEWATKWVMHFRWFHSQDIDKASKILPLINTKAFRPNTARSSTV